jgi:quercetin dioxygenase-like cupin family protein
MFTSARNTVTAGRVCLMALTAVGPSASSLHDAQPQAAVPTTGQAPQPVVTELLIKPLQDLPGREVLMLSVEYPPGGADPVYRHLAHAFVHVLEGSIVMQVRGGRTVTLTRGQSFYEGPDDIHVVGRNARSTAPAKFVAFLLKGTGRPPFVPAA